MKKEPKKSFFSKGIYPYRWAFLLLCPLRNIFLSPKKLIQRLGLRNNSIMLEVGSGPGYFSAYVAKSIPNGRLYLVDIQQEMLDIAQKRLSKRKITNVEYHRCDGHTFPYRDNQFDIVYLVSVIGEIENKDEYIKEFYRVIKNGGILSISELGGDPDRLSIDELKNLMHEAGFVFYRLYGKKKNFTINFKKRN